MSDEETLRDRVQRVMREARDNYGPISEEMAQELRGQYAAALCAAEGHDWEEIKASYPADVAEYLRMADAAMDVAGAEQEYLLSEIERLRDHVIERGLQVHRAIQAAHELPDQYMRHVAEAIGPQEGEEGKA